MLRVKAQTSLRNARRYFRHHLNVGDYYAAGHTVAGEWLGQAAADLGLIGKVGGQAFLALCEGRHPDTAKRLTLRLNSVRRQNGRETANRRIAYDFTISPPKSYSIVALCQDERLVALHDEAVCIAMKELEKYAETRVRTSRQNASRPTGRIAAACFRHDTSRELDPHLHTHCVVFNATFDAAEARWKALQTQGMFRAQKLAEALYYHELCRGLKKLGYEIESGPASFEIAGVPPSLITWMSKRHQQIDDETARRLNGGTPTVRKLAELRERIAHDKRRRKMKQSSADQLRLSWLGQMSSAERLKLTRLCSTPAMPALPPVDAPAIIEWAGRHIFERKSVVTEAELLATALSHARGRDLALATLRAAITQAPDIAALKAGRYTSKELIQLETELVSMAGQGLRTQGAIHWEFKTDERLSVDQQRAVTKLLQSYSFVTVLRGAAGSGKSFALRDVKRGTEEAKRPFVLLAPQRQQVIDLEADGLPAQTLAQFLTAPRLPPGAVIVLDEAGQVGVRDMHQLAVLAKGRGGRLILCGDTRQHGAVAASDALVLLERQAGVPVAKLTKNRRQDPNRVDNGAQRRMVAAYRSAVRRAAEGNAIASFDRLDALGWVKECDPEERRKLLAQSYLTALRAKERVLVVAQTRKEVEAANFAVRQARIAAAEVGPSLSICALRSTDLTAAQKQAAENYRPGARIFFVKNYGRFRRGDVCPVIDTTDSGIVLLKEGRRTCVNFSYAERWTVVEERTLDIGPGDRLQLKWNGRSVEGRRIANGQIVTVLEVRPDGSLAVEAINGERLTLGRNQRLFDYGYAVTSYASQGKTVDTVILADAGPGPATNRKQWYVTISRARRQALVFTPNKEALRTAIAADGHRVLATEASSHGRWLSRSLKLAQDRKQGIGGL